jgi:hypothetical protein
MHSEEPNLSIGDNFPRGQFHDRNIDVTSEKREREQRKHITAINADFFIGITEDADLNQRNQKYDQQEQKQ